MISILLNDRPQPHYLPWLLNRLSYSSVLSDTNRWPAVLCCAIMSVQIDDLQYSSTHLAVIYCRPHQLRQSRITEG